MTRFVRCLSRVALALALLGLVWLLSASAHAQRPAAPLSKRLTPIKDFKTREGRAVYSQFQAMKKGEQAPNKDIIDQAAQWYAYRLTYHELINDPNLGEQGLRGIIREAKDQILPLPTDPKKPLSSLQQQFSQEFSKRFSERLMEVLQDGRPIVRINAAQILAKLAETGQEELVDPLTAIIKNPQELEGVKLYAFKGLATLFALARGEDPLIKIKKEREVQAILALLDYIKRAISTGELSPGEVEAVRYIRRDAIRALAETRYPALEATKDKKRVLEGLTAQTLLHIVKGEGLTPPPSVSERAEAAIGLCQLQGKVIPEYQADYAAHHVARFVVDFADQFTKEGANRNDPWRILAARLQHALAELRTDTDVTRNPPPVREYVKSVELQAKPVLDRIATSGLTGDVAPLATWLDQTPPPNPTLYKGMANVEIKPQEKAQ